MRRRRAADPRARSYISRAHAQGSSTTATLVDLLSRQGNNKTNINAPSCAPCPRSVALSSGADTISPSVSCRCDGRADGVLSTTRPVTATSPRVARRSQMHNGPGYLSVVYSSSSRRGRLTWDHSTSARRLPAQARLASHGLFIYFQTSLRLPGDQLLIARVCLFYDCSTEIEFGRHLHCQAEPWVRHDAPTLIMLRLEVIRY